MGSIYHIIPREEWEAAVPGPYQPASLAAEGFIHCSTRSQVLGTANAIFAGRPGLLLLEIDEARVASEIIYEDCYETGQRFPHIYGPLDSAAVIRIHDFPCGPDGLFTLDGF